MKKMKLNIQLFAEVQILDESKGGSNPTVYYKIWADVTNRTSTTVTIKFRITSSIKSGSSWNKTSSGLYCYMEVYGQQSETVWPKPNNTSWGSGPVTKTNYITQTITGISPTLTSIPAANIRFIAKRSKGGSAGPINTTMSRSLTIPIGQLPINFNGTEGITAVNFNGNNVEHLYFNGVRIF